MALHPRYRSVSDAKIEAAKAILEIEQKYDLTFVELVQVLTDVLQTATKYALRAERHPNDPDKPADRE